MGPALAANRGSPGNTQLRIVQGLMAFSCSRQMVVPPMSATDRGRPVSWEISHARALTATTGSGNPGKPPRADRPGLVAETDETPSKNCLRHLLTIWGGVTIADHLVAQALGGAEDDPCAQDVYIR